MSVSSRNAAYARFEFEPNRYPRSLPSWDTTNAEYGRADYRRRMAIDGGVSSSVYRPVPARHPGDTARRIIDEGLGGFKQNRSTYVDEISDVAIQNYTRTSQVHAHYDGVERIGNAGGPYAASAIATTKNMTAGQLYGTSVASSQTQYHHPSAKGEEYVRVCCPGLHASIPALH